MSAIYNDLTTRVQSKSPSAFKAYGYAAQREDAKVTIYDGQPLPRFLLDHGSRPHEFRAWLLANRIGSPFEESELGSGKIVSVANTADDFPRHPDLA